MKQNPDIISVSDIPVRAIIGILPWERLIAQPLVVDVQLTLDIRRAASSGNLAETFDYSLVPGLVQTVLEQGQFHLVETGLHEIARVIMATARVEIYTIQVSLQKPLALNGQGQVRVTINRTRTD